MIGIGIGIGRNRFGTGSTPVGLLLDTYSGAAAAYSLRKLSNTYSGSAIQVRRSSDDDILDVGFVGGELDTTSLETFVNAQDVKPADYGEGAAAAYSLRYVSASYGGFVIGARRDDNETLDFTPTQITDGTLATWSQGGNVYVHTWYDQSGNGNDATQAIAESQGKIVSSGSVILENGEPTCQYDGIDDNYIISINISNIDTSIFAVATQRNNSDRQDLLRGSSGFLLLGSYVTGTEYRYRGGSNVNSYATINTNQNLHTAINTSTESKAAINNNTLNVVSDTHINETTIYWGNYIHATNYVWEGNVQELIFYFSDQSSNRTNIETEINSYYNIYTSTADGFVTTWYDQSGNGRNATQSTASAQPQIVSSGSVILENGKPNLVFDGGDFFGVSSTLFASQQFSIYTVNSASNTSGNREIISNWRNINTFSSVFLGTKNGVVRFTDSLANGGSYGSTSTRKILSAISSASDAVVYLNDEQIGSRGSALPLRNLTTNFYIGVQGTLGSEYWLGTIDEIIVYPSDSMSDKSNIHDNINNFYNIY